MNVHGSEHFFRTTCTPGKLLITVVARGQGEKAMQLAKAAGARGGTIMLGRSSVESPLLRLLSLDDKDVDIVLTLLAHEEMEPVLASLRAGAGAGKLGKGFSMGLDVGKILRHHLAPAAGRQNGSFPAQNASPLTRETERTPMSAAHTHELISIIVNTGYADDIMDAARAAGAPGGTVINARGTGREEDVKFFGLTIVPEKEFIMILVPREKAGEVLEAVKTAPCLNQPGLGIAFCLDVERFIPLGKKKRED
ncbi:MAG: P-II family nitrogen regulator [Desulfovibrio sp.]|jgi:nitrogen regulatory protein PII|nr:P-II family nitrogen regulator [Desulfovibrio sp.]